MSLATGRALFYSTRLGPYLWSHDAKEAILPSSNRLPIPIQGMKANFNV
jgi:hypothetical protein